MDSIVNWAATTADELVATARPLRSVALGRAIQELFGCDTYARIQSRPNVPSVKMHSGRTTVDNDLQVAVTTVLQSHPQILSYQSRPWDDRPRRLSDLIGLQTWLAHPVYNAIGRQTGNRYQLTIRVRRDPGSPFTGWVLNRTGADFRERDLDKAVQVQAALSALDRLALGPTTDGGSSREGAAALTPRELEVMTLLSQGLTAGAIGHLMKISDRTVRKHLENVYRKIGARDRLTAVQFAIRTGIIPGC